MSLFFLLIPLISVRVPSFNFSNFCLKWMHGISIVPIRIGWHQQTWFIFNALAMEVAPVASIWFSRRLRSTKVVFSLSAAARNGAPRSVITTLSIRRMIKLCDGSISETYRLDQCHHPTVLTFKTSAISLVPSTPISLPEMSNSFTVYPQYPECSFLGYSICVTNGVSHSI